MDPAEVFDDDYLYFYEVVLDGERSDRETDVAWRLLGLEPGSEVLDCPCGYGRIANRLASRGARVTGVDATPLFLERARADAAARGVDVEYVEGDMRDLPWAGRFDAALNWFTSFGYFDDTDNRRVLHAARRALKSGGRFAVETINRDGLAARLHPWNVTERDDDLMIDRLSLDPVSGRMENERIVVRGGTVRRFPWSVWAPTFGELRDRLLDAGFSTVEAFGADGGELTRDHRRLIAVATA